MKVKRIRKKTLEAADEIVGTAVDAALFILYLGFTATSARTMYEAMNTSDKIESLHQRFNYASLKQAIYVLTRKEFVVRSPKRTHLDISITELGKKRLASFIPTYQTNRPWDGFVYLVSYDIPTKLNYARDLLREHIKRTGGKKLQESLWINPYNPSLLLEEFATEHNVPGTILVSKLGKDGTIGENKLTDMIIRIYDINKLAGHYHNFIEEYVDAPKDKSKTLIHDYLSILKNDPQLPFELLPKNFPGSRAYDIAKPFLDTLPFKS